MHFLVLAALIAATLPAAPDTLVVCPAAFRAALAPWESYRREQGHVLAVVEPPTTAAELRAQIRDAARGGQLKYVVLLGDVSEPRADTTETPDDRAPTVPTAYAEARVNIRWGSEPTIATDQLFADVDGDGSPDVAVGRIPADTPDELAAVVRKVLCYEQQADQGLWRRQVNVVAGIGGFGPVTDALVDAAARGVIQQFVPAAYEVGQTIANPASQFCPPPDEFTTEVCRQISEGCFLWVYLGHGLPTALDAIETPRGLRPILSVREVPRLRCGANSPLAVLIACYTGAIDAPTDCLAEELLIHEQGPVAVIAGTRVTMPYGNAVFGSELLRACFKDRPATLGELWTMAQRRTLADASDDPLRSSLDALALGVSPPPVDLAAERREHVLLYQLLGDPLLCLKYPGNVRLAETSAVNGGRLAIDGESDLAGRCVVELLPAGSAGRGREVLARTVESIEAGPFHVVLPIPSSSAGAYTARAFVAGDRDFAVGVGTVNVERSSVQRVSRAAGGTPFR